MPMPGLDAPVPLASATQFMSSAFADLATNLAAGELTNIMVEATRACEGACSGRRLAPFTTTETHRAEGIDPDEYGDTASNMPLDLAGTLGRSYANALGVADQVRHLWLTHRAWAYPEYWGPYTVTGLTIFRSIGGSQLVTVSTVQGPDPDTGHVWFPLGTFLPAGSIIQVTYTGGYGTIPADLGRACKAMAASIIIKELDPNMGSAHDPDLLRDEAIEFLAPYMPH